MRWLCLSISFDVFNQWAKHALAASVSSTDVSMTPCAHAKQSALRFPNTCISNLETKKLKIENNLEPTFRLCTIYTKTRTLSLSPVNVVLPSVCIIFCS